jgi:hypothetical protein
VCEHRTVNSSLTALDGVRVGHFQRIGKGWLTGTTVVFTPLGAVGGVDVRGGGPGTRETDVLRPENLVHQVHAVCLSGGSAFGLGAADGVMRRCAELGVGLPVGANPDDVVPIVPAAIIFDLGRGGHFGNHPTAEFGYQATATASRRPVRSGCVGAGTGAVAGGLKGGVGNAAITLEDGTVVAALAVVNAAGSLVDRETAMPWLPVDGLRRPDREDRRRLQEVLDKRAAPATADQTPLNTTIGVVATNAALTKAECTKLAQVAHDGLARAANPSHLLVDGDTVFALSTRTTELSTAPTGASLSDPNARHVLLNRILAAGADAFGAACVDALVSARGMGRFRAYRDLCPSAFAGD